MGFRCFLATRVLRCSFDSELIRNLALDLLSSSGMDLDVCILCGLGLETDVKFGV